MNSKEIEHLKRNSIYTVKLCNEMKESVISSKLNDLSKNIKKEIKQNELVVVVMKVS